VRVIIFLRSTLPLIRWSGRFVGNPEVIQKRASRKLAGLAALFAPAADCGWIGGYTETPVTVHGSWRS